MADGGAGGVLLNDRDASVTLFRAVTAPELGSIQLLGTFSNPAGIEVKYFSTSLEGARWYASQAASAFGDGPFGFIQTSMATLAITAEMSVTVDRGIQTIVVPTQQLSGLTTHHLGHDGLAGGREVVSGRCHMNDQHPDIIATVHLYRTDAGGRRGPTPHAAFNCLFTIDGRNFDARLHLDGLGSLVPGQTAKVPITFLDREGARTYCTIGGKFLLREMNVIGDGVIEEMTVLDQELVTR